jgi:hypothetical protein
MLFERGQRHDIQCPLVGGRQHHVGGSPVVVGPQPIDSCHAPSVPGHQTGEPVPDHRGAQIVADSRLVLEEFRGHHRADGVAPLILGTGMAAAVSKESGDRVIAACPQRATQHVEVFHGGSISQDSRSRAGEAAYCHYPGASNQNLPHSSCRNRIGGFLGRYQRLSTEIRNPVGRDK